MAEVAPEIETKFDVAPDFSVPPLDALAGKHGHVDVDVVHRASTYYDTEARDLLRQRLALRRRLGDADTGWQLKVPASEGRTELRWPPEGDEPPIEMLDLLGPFLRGHRLHPAVTVDTTRTRHRLVAEDGSMLAEIAADDVRAIDEGGGVRAPRWHEVEVELGEGSRDLLQEVGKRLRHAGACPSTSRSKLARASVGIGNEGVGTPRTSAGALLLDYLNTQADAIVAGHFAIHRDADDAVHKTRVACRRTRSTLRTFGDFFDADQASGFEAELKWYAEVLGNVRDAEVLRADSRQLSPICRLTWRSAMSGSASTSTSRPSTPSGWTNCAWRCSVSGMRRSLPRSVGGGRTRRSRPPRDGRRRRCKKASCGWPSGSASGSLERRRQVAPRRTCTALARPASALAMRPRWPRSRRSPTLSITPRRCRTSWASTRTAWSPPRCCSDSRRTPQLRLFSASACSSLESADWLRRPGSRPAPRTERPRSSSATSRRTVRR